MQLVLEIDVLNHFVLAGNDAISVAMDANQTRTYEYHYKLHFTYRRKRGGFQRFDTFLIFLDLAQAVSGSLNLFEFFSAINTSCMPFVDCITGLH